MRLAIVGSRSLAGDPRAARLIDQLLDEYTARDPQLTVVSGGAAGIDRMAVAAARRRGLAVVEHLPGGAGRTALFERNRAIARDCDELIRIADPASSTYGSGWTQDRARELGRPTREYRVARDAPQLELGLER